VARWHHRLLWGIHRAVLDGGGWGVEPPAKISDPLLLLKKRKGGRLSMYLCISTVVDFNSQNFDPLMKFDKYSPGYSYIRGPHIICPRLE